MNHHCIVKNQHKKIFRSKGVAPIINKGKTRKVWKLQLKWAFCFRETLKIQNEDMYHQLLNPLKQLHGEVPNEIQLVQFLRQKCNFSGSKVYTLHQMSKTRQPPTKQLQTFSIIYELNIRMKQIFYLRDCKSWILLGTSLSAYH